MTFYDGPLSEKRCFAYCGDDLCNCTAGPRGRALPPDFSPEPGWLLADAEKAAKRANELGLPRYAPAHSYKMGVCRAMGIRSAWKAPVVTEVSQ